MKEIWKVFKKTPRYMWEVSNFGNVKRNGKLIDLDNDYRHFGYYRFGSDYSVHRAVAILFIPNPENKPCVDHIDTNKKNNKVDNLRWVTYKENSNNKLSKQHLSEKLKGRYIDDEWRKNISLGTKKAMAKPEVRKKCSESHIGKIPWNKNKHYSNEQKLNVSIGTKKAMDNPEIRKKMRENKRKLKLHWMTNGNVSKLVPESEQQKYLDNGYYNGRI